MIIALEFSIFLGNQSNADELQYPISVIEPIDWKTVSAANNRRPKGWRWLSSHSPVRPESMGDLVKYKAQSRRVLIMNICSDRQARPSILPSNSRKESTMLACLSHAVFEILVTGATSNTPVRILARRFWAVSECDEDQFVEAPQVNCLSAAESSLLLLLTHNSTSLFVDAFPEVQVEEPGVYGSSAKRVCSCSTAHPIALMSQWISAPDRLSIIRDFVERVRNDVYFADTGDEIRGYLWAK